MNKGEIEQLLEVMRCLRDPENGCPWDQKQDFSSIVPYTIEEAYEVADAIEHEDYAELKSELGDLLFQVVFYAQLAKEKALFDFYDVVQAIVEKMIRRHPHVFAEARFSDEAELREAWEQQKLVERKHRGKDESSLLDGVARALPALVRAEKLQKKASRVGFDWQDASGALEKCKEEISEIELAMKSEDRSLIEEEAGDLLVAATNVVRLLGLDPEQTLRRGNDKFVRRFQAMEKLLRLQGYADLSQLDLNILESAWQEVKRSEKNSD